MSAISAHPNAVSSLGSPLATSLVPPAGSDPASGDALASMRPAMDAANAIGRPTDSSGAAGILATTGSYLQGAFSTLVRLDEGIARKEADQLRLEATDPTAAAKGNQQLDLLHQLRDRIQLSIERINDVLAGKDRPDIGGPDASSSTGGEASGRNSRDRREDEDLLEQRRRLLAPSGFEAVAAPATSVVAGAYAAGDASLAAAVAS